MFNTFILTNSQPFFTIIDFKSFLATLEAKLKSFKRRSMPPDNPTKLEPAALGIVLPPPPNLKLTLRFLIWDFCYFKMAVSNDCLNSDRYQRQISKSITPFFDALFCVSARRAMDFRNISFCCSRVLIRMLFAITFFSMS